MEPSWTVRAASRLVVGGVAGPSAVGFGSNGPRWLLPSVGLGLTALAAVTHVEVAGAQTGALELAAQIVVEHELSQ